MPTTVNYLAVLVAAVAAMAIGAAWYSPAVFGKAWMTLSGLSAEKLEEMKKKGMGKAYGLTFVGQLVMAYVMAHFANFAKATTVSGGLQLGFWTWLGFIATAMLGMVLWDEKPWKLYWLNTLHYLAVMLVMGVILAVWR